MITEEMRSELQEREDLHAKISELGARLADALQAIGLASTAVPDMVVDVNDPVGMMQRVVDEVGRLRRSCAGWEADAMREAGNVAYWKERLAALEAELANPRASILLMKLTAATKAAMYCTCQIDTCPAVELVRTVLDEIDGLRTVTVKIVTDA